MVDAPGHMRRASVLALSGLCLALPRAATAAEPPPLPAESEPSLPPADATTAPAGDAPPALPDGGAGAAAPVEAPPTADVAATDPAPAVEGAASAELSPTAADLNITGATDTTKSAEPGMVRGRREPVMNSLRGGVGLYHSTLADVGARHSVRFRLHTDFFRKTGFIYNSSDEELGADQHARVRGTINLGYSPFKWGELFVAIHSQANRNTRKQPGRQDPPQQFALGDLDFGIKGAHRMVKGGAIGIGGQLGVGLLSGPGRLRTDKVNFNIDALFTLDVRYLTKKQFPFRFTTNIGWILDNSAKLYDFEAISDATSREVSRFALGINPSRVRMRYGFDFPIRLGKEKQYGLNPIAELSWDIATQQMSAFKQEGATPSPLPKSSMWATIGLRANVVSGLHLDLAADIGMVSPNFEYGPPVAPWSLILGLGWAIDPNPVVKEVPAPVIETPPPAIIDGRVVGQVLDPSGAPISGALVRFPGAAGNAIVTDEAGNFTSFRFPEGAVTVLVELQNKATKEVSAEVKAGEDTQLTIAMDVANTPPAGFVDGAFVDDAGAPVAITLAVTGMGIDEPFKSNEAGLIRLELPAGEYGAIARAEGFEDKVLRFTVAAGDQAVVVKETLTRSVPPSTPNVIGKGKSLRLKKSIKYDGNNPNEKTLPILDELAAYLRVHPEYETVEIGVHSDDRGNPKTKTSERADNVRNYLLSKGVSPDRVTAVGFGASRPVAVNMTASGRAKNNRTVLRVTKYTKPTAAAPAATPAPGK
jgi:outer membrane protein OmpA-like peptidoglycan-associated protein